MTNPQLTENLLTENLLAVIRSLPADAQPPSGQLSPVLLTMRGLKEMTGAPLQRGCQS